MAVACCCGVKAGLDGYALELAGPHRDDLEPAFERQKRRVPGQPRLRGEPQPPQFLLVDHLERVAEPIAGLPLDLAEDEPTAAPDDQIELVPAGPDIRAEDAVAAQAVVAGGASLESAFDVRRGERALKERRCWSLGPCSRTAAEWPGVM